MGLSNSSVNLFFFTADLFRWDDTILGADDHYLEGPTRINRSEFINRSWYYWWFMSPLITWLLALTKKRWRFIWGLSTPYAMLPLVSRGGKPSHTIPYQISQIPTYMKISICYRCHPPPNEVINKGFDIFTLLVAWTGVPLDFIYGCRFRLDFGFIWAQHLIIFDSISSCSELTWAHVHPSRREDADGALDLRKNRNQHAVLKDQNIPRISEPFIMPCLGRQNREQLWILKPSRERLLGDTTTLLLQELPILSGVSVSISEVSCCKLNLGCFSCLPC